MKLSFVLRTSAGPLMGLPAYTGCDAGRQALTISAEKLRFSSCSESRPYRLMQLGQCAGLLKDVRRKPP